jgi:hypothetical protein
LFGKLFFKVWLVRLMRFFYHWCLTAHIWLSGCINNRSMIKFWTFIEMILTAECEVNFSKEFILCLHACRNFFSYPSMTETVNHLNLEVSFPCFYGIKDVLLYKWILNKASNQPGVIWKEDKIKNLKELESLKDVYSAISF